MAATIACRKELSPLSAVWRTLKEVASASMMATAAWVRKPRSAPPVGGKDDTQGGEGHRRSEVQRDTFALSDLESEPPPPPVQCGACGRCPSLPSRSRSTPLCTSSRFIAGVVSISA